MFYFMGSIIIQPMELGPTDDNYLFHLLSDDELNARASERARASKKRKEKTKEGRRRTTVRARRSCCRGHQGICLLRRWCWIGTSFATFTLKIASFYFFSSCIWNIFGKPPLIKCVDFFPCFVSYLCVHLEKYY